MANELKPCPFCGGKAHYTKEIASAGLAAVVMCSDNDCCTNHAGTLQEAIDLWNTRPAAPVEGFEGAEKQAWENYGGIVNVGVGDIFIYVVSNARNKKAPYLQFRLRDRVISRDEAKRLYDVWASSCDKLRERKKTTTPVEGLETVHTQGRFNASDVWRNEVFVGERGRIAERRELVAKSQAVAIIAARDRTISDLRSEVESLSAIVKSEIADVAGASLDELEADNAALTARVKELGEALDKQRELDNESTLQHYNRAKALETQLAAAKKAHKSLFGDKTMEGILWPDVKPTDLITIRVQKQIYDKARAALEEKP